MNKQVERQGGTTSGPLLERRAILGGAILLGGAALLPGLTSCASKTGSGTNRTTPHGIRFATLGDSSSQTLDPQVNSGYQIGMPIYDRLTTMSPDLKKVLPGLAESWESSADLKTWRFRIRADAHWHDGEPVTVKDVRYSLRRILDPKVGSPAAAVLGQIPPSNVVVEGDNTVVIRLTKAAWNLPILVSYKHASIIPSHITTDDLAERGIGSGPFQVSGFRAGKRLDLKEFHDYWKSDYPRATSLSMSFVGTSSTRIAGLETGEFNLISDVNVNSSKEMKGKPKLTVVERPGAGRLMFVMNVSRPPFNDVRVRQALALSCDRQELNRRVYNGLGTVGADVPISPVVPFRSGIANTPPSRDIDRARTLLSDAGYKRGLEVTLYTSDLGGEQVSASLLLKQQVKSCGIEINVEKVDPSSFYDTIWGQKAFYTLYYRGEPSDEILSIMYRTGGAWNLDGYHSREFDQAFDAARSEPDHRRRASAYRKVFEILRRDVPMLIPIFPPLLEAHTQEIKYPPSPLDQQRNFSLISVTDG